MTSGSNWASLAFASVQRRGFHANVPLHCKDALLAAQFVRLVEEYLEWGAEFVNAESEMADVCIVAANVVQLRTALDAVPLQEIMQYVHGTMYDVRAGADDYMPDDYDADRAAIDAWLRKELSAE